MHWIATAALVVIAGCAVLIMLWIRAAVLEFTKGPLICRNTHIVPAELLEAIEDFSGNFTRRRKTKKEAANGQG